MTSVGLTFPLVRVPVSEDEDAGESTWSAARKWSVQGPREAQFPESMPQSRPD